MAEEEVKLLGYWGSPYALRIQWALKLKGIKYDYQEEDLRNKSPLLLESNPVYKQIPVLLHNGKPIAESLAILEYIDDVWKHYPLLPEDPYERAQARFWAKFVDDKCVPAMLSAFLNVGEEQEKSEKEAREHLKSLEGGVEKGKRYSGVNQIGFLDVAAAWLGIWGGITDEIAGTKLIDEEAMPFLAAWFRGVLEDPIMKECLPPYDKLLAHCKDVHSSRTAAVKH